MEKGLVDLQTPPPEPRFMTLADVMAMVAGFGVAFAIRPAAAGMPFPIAIPAWVVIALMGLWLLLALEMAVSVVVLLRQARYHRPARPAEWIAILLSLTLFQKALPNVDDLVNRWLGTEWFSTSFGLRRWVVSGAGAAVFLGGIALLVLTRRRLPHWSKTVLLAGSLLALLWGPIEVFAREVPWLIPRAVEQPSRLFWIDLEIRKSLGLLPLGLLFGLPAAATILEWTREGRNRRDRTWTETLGSGIALFLGVVWLVYLYLGKSESPPDGLNAERIVAPVWIAGVWWLSRLLVVRFGTVWGCWLTPTARPDSNR